MDSRALKHAFFEVHMQKLQGLKFLLVNDPKPSAWPRGTKYPGGGCSQNQYVQYL